MVNTGKLMLTSFAAAVVLTAAGCPQVREVPPSVELTEANYLAVREAINAGAEGAAGSSAALAEPTGWATISGRFTISGQAPALPPIVVTKEQNICGVSAPNETLVVGPGGGIKDVLIYLITETPADNPKWEHPSYADSKTAVIDYDQKECIFLTHVLAMRSTQSLRILNSDPTGHNTNITPSRGAASFNQTIPTGAQVSYSPGGASPAPFNVSCSIHPWMSARMITRDNPYFAVTQPDGSFTIANVPAGVELEFRVWQERADFLEDVTVNGSAVKWSKGRFEQTFEPDQTLEMDVVVDAAVFQ